MKWHTQYFSFVYVLFSLQQGGLRYIAQTRRPAQMMTPVMSRSMRQ